MVMCAPNVNSILVSNPLIHLIYLVIYWKEINTEECIQLIKRDQNSKNIYNVIKYLFFEYIYIQYINIFNRKIN